MILANTIFKNGRDAFGHIFKMDARDRSTTSWLRKKRSGDVEDSMAIKGMHFGSDHRGVIVALGISKIWK